MDQTVGETNLGNKDFLCICPAHHINIDQQGRNDDIGPVFPEFVQGDSLGEGEVAEFFIIIPQ